MRRGSDGQKKERRGGKREEGESCLKFVTSRRRGKNWERTVFPYNLKREKERWRGEDKINAVWGGREREVKGCEEVLIRRRKRNGCKWY